MKCTKCSKKDHNTYNHEAATAIDLLGELLLGKKK